MKSLHDRLAGYFFVLLITVMHSMAAHPIVTVLLLLSITWGFTKCVRSTLRLDLLTMLASLLFVGFPLLAVTVSQVYYFWFETSVEAYFWGAALLALAAVTSNALIAWHRWRFRHQHNESMLVLPIVCGFFSVGLCSYLFYIAGFISPAPTTYIEHEVPFIETVLAFFFLAQPVDWLVYAKYHRD